MKLFALFFLFIPFLFVGCASHYQPLYVPIQEPTPTETQLSNANYGIVPTDYEEQIKAFWTPRLIDPTSPIFSFGTPLHEYSSDISKSGLYYGGGGNPDQMVFGYRVDHSVNAKNSYGGYTGGQIYSAFFLNGQLVAVGECSRDAKKYFGKENQNFNRVCGVEYAKFYDYK